MYTYHARVVRVVDGDTYDLHVDLGFRTFMEDRFRLFGADTPEVYGPNACEEGKEVSAIVAKLLHVNEALGAKGLKIETHKDRRGKYGRWLVNVELLVDEHGEEFEEPVWLAGYLIKQGYAKEYE